MLRFTVLFLSLTPLFALMSAQTNRTDVSTPPTAFSEDARFAGVTMTKQSGWLILRGTVRSCNDKREVLKQVSSMGGVKEVEDHLEVKTKRVADRSLTREIDQNLKDHNFRAVRFHVSNGIVTLRGTLPSDSDRAQVVSLICRQAGVVDVDGRGVRALAHASGK